jgi:predicted RNA-binding protein YlxR (DUF448 family)
LKNQRLKPKEKAKLASSDLEPDRQHPDTEAGEDEVNPRSCIVSRQRFDRADLIRFVIAPDGQVVADLKENLPGRGVWVEGRREVIKKAVDKQLFARSLKTQCQADEGLTDRLDGLLNERALQALALTKKAGLLVTGFTKVDGAIRENRALLLFHAKNGADDGKRKLASAIASLQHMGGEPVEVVQCWSIDEMSTVLGLGNVIHAAALAGGASGNLVKAVRRLEKYRA